MNNLMRCLVMFNVFFLTLVSSVLADDPKAMVTDYSTKMIEILQGPVSKLFGAIILLVGASALLRGRHAIAISCGLAFVMLLFLPILLQHLGG